MFDQKVRACSRLVHKYLERAASPFPDLTNVTTFFNTDTELSTVQAIACKDGSVCVEDTPAYSLFGESLDFVLSQCDELPPAWKAMSL